jgi:2-iminobutanoate/2-iminopropanoate deaminase
MACSCDEKKAVVAPKAPKALGPYSAAIKVGDFVYCSGQTGLNPETNELAEGGLEGQTHQVLKNLANVLEAAGTDMAHVVKTTVFLKDMADFQKMNAIYGTYFTENYPARSTIQVAGLPKNGLVEIELVAVLPEEDCDCECGEESGCGCGCGCNKE